MGGIGVCCSTPFRQKNVERMGHPTFVEKQRVPSDSSLRSCGVIQGFGDHDLAYCFGRAVLGQAASAEACGQLGLQTEKLAGTGATCAWASLLRMAAVGCQNINGH